MNRTAHGILISALALIVLVGIALAAGCASTPPGPTATTTPSPASTAAAGTVATTATSGSGSGSAAVSAVPAERLVPFIPKTAGAWKLNGEPLPISMKDGDGNTLVMVNGEYVKDGDSNAKANIMIIDSAIGKSQWAEQWKSLGAVETSEMSWRSVTVKGQPGWKSLDKKTNSYAEWVLAGNRYLVIATIDGGSDSDTDPLMNAVDFAGLAAVK